MRRRWKIKAHDSELIRTIESEAKVSPMIAQILALRGITHPQEIKRFMETPFQELRPGSELPGATEAAEQIYQSIQADEKIVIYGDYDADGMTATAILIRCLQMLGANATFFVPNRMDDGYGLNPDNLQKLHEQGAQLVITVDCGITSLEEAQLAKSLGLKLIITDHHQFGDELPEVAAIVHPGIPVGAYPFSGLCGAGVALKLAWTLCQRASGSDKVSPAQRSFLLRALGLAAIGTITDMVPLVDENRLIVKHGLAFLPHEPVEGLQQLMKLTKLDQKPSLSTEDIGFMIGPRLNATGRLGQAQLGVELLTTSSSARAEALAEYIHQLNDSRDSLERRIYKSANQEIQDHSLHEQPAIVLARRDWHPGVIGIVAGRLAEKYNRPTILIAQDEMSMKPGMGSCRSACGINLFDALQSCREWLVSCGGHKQAAGLKVNDDQIESFREAFMDYVAERTHSQDLQPELDIDVEVPLSHLTLSTISELEKLAPYGQAHPRPVFCACGVRLQEPPRKIGNGQRHLAFRVEQHSVSMRCVAFGAADWAEELEAENRLFDFAFQPFINEFRGRRTVELRLLDFRINQVVSPALKATG